jgi:soluble lytic murein transglycosylase-like protein/TolA-binding protein
MKFAAYLLALLLIATFAATTVAQSQSDLAARIRAAVEVGNWEGARADIETLRSTEPALFNSGSYSYLLGRIAEQSGDATTATIRYQESVNTQLAEYALWRLARFARTTGDLTLEREHLRRLLSTVPTSILRDAASLRLAESFSESGDFNSAINSARTIVATKNVALAREAATLVAAAYNRSQKKTEARDAYLKLLMQMPDASRPDDFALTAVRELDELDKNDAGVLKLSEADHLLRASVYHFNRDFKGARTHYQAVVDANSQSGTVPNALYQLGRGYYLESNYEQATKLFQQVVDQHAQTSSARDALGFLASSYVRMKRAQDAVTTYQLLLQRFPDAPNPERTYLNIIDALHEAGRYADALTWVQQAQTRFKNDLGGGLALFARLRIHLAQGQWSEVVRDADELSKFADLGGTRVPGGTTNVEVSFLRAFALEQLGRTDEAISAYLAIPDGRNEYYGARATQRLLALGAKESTRPKIRSRFNSLSTVAQNDEGRRTLQTRLRLTQDQSERTELLKALASLYEALPAYKLQRFNLLSLENRIPKPVGGDAETRGGVLWKLGLYDEAMPEFYATTTSSTAPAGQSVSNDEAYTMAVYSLRGGFANRAVRFAEQFWRTVPADYVIDLAPRDLTELLYPAPYRSSLLRHAPNRNVDPRFVLSIARQESRYQADAKSVAAARGMMQFIPSTALEIAAQLKLAQFKQGDLYHPDTAILFGSEYLSTLFQQFPNQPQAVAGSYNGGADNLARWIGRSKSAEPDRYVPEIGFSQTKDYVYKVMANFWNYQRLYDAQLNPQQSTTTR